MPLTFLVPASLGKAKTEARAELIQQALASHLGEPVKIVVPVDYKEFEDRVLDGSAQIFWGPASICARVEHSARAIFKVVRNGNHSYRSVIVARGADDLTLGRLAGLRAAWVDRLSIGGYLLAADLLRRRGIDPDRALASQTFEGSHPAACSAVLHGTADFAAVTTTRGDDASIKSALEMYVGRAASKLVALAVTDDAPTDGVVLTSRLSALQEANVIRRIFGPDADIKLSSVLLSAMDAESFVRARPGEYAPLRRLLRPSGASAGLPSRSKLKPP